MKKRSDLFDVLMGAYGGADVCDLVGIFLLNLLGKQYDTKILAYIGTIDCQFLKTVVVCKWKRLRSPTKCFST